MNWSIEKSLEAAKDSTNNNHLTALPAHPPMEDTSNDYVKKEESAFASCLYSASSASTPSSIKHEEALNIYGSVPSHVKIEPDPHHLYSASAVAAASAAAAIGLLHPHPNSVYDPLPQRSWLSERSTQVQFQFYTFNLIQPTYSFKSN